MATGTVAWFHETKGFGFIKPDSDERDVFVHITAVHKAGMSILTQGTRLEFDIGELNGRRAAVNLRR